MKSLNNILVPFS